MDKARRLVGGSGRFIDDSEPPGLLYGAFLRADEAHAELLSVEVDAARAMPGVLLVLTGDDLRAEGVGPIPTTMEVEGRDGRAFYCPPRHALAVGRVRHVGESIALIVASTLAQAKDAAEAISLRTRPLGYVTDIRNADTEQAPLIWDEAPGNLCLDYELGDAQAVEGAFAEASHVTKITLANNRIAVCSMEPRGAIASFEHGRYTLRTGTQGTYAVREVLAKAVLNVPPAQLRVLTDDVGGAFGMKTPVYPEYVALLAAARQLGRSIKWINSRAESFLSDNAGRDSSIEGQLALNAEGSILALRVRTRANMGAYLTHVGPYIPTVQTGRSLASVYRTPAIHMRVRCFFTNTVPVGPYRGAGRPEANLIVERLIEKAAAETGWDPVELRRRNLIPPTAMPYTTPTGVTYDSGDFPKILEQLLDRAEWHDFVWRVAESRARGRLRGGGLACYLEATGGMVPERADI
ncbi:MAG: molybdopterin cofactor-binding domain-containing protein, partial [Pseudomonadota bacterium]